MPTRGSGPFGFPGGKRGPNRATKFVVRKRPFADGVAVVAGMFAVAVTQLVLVEAEQDARRVNHAERLLFGRVAAPITVQPVHLWKKQAVQVEAEQEVAATPPTLHRYRTGYQTVGHSFQTWPKPAVSDRSIEPDAQRVPQTLLHSYRQSFQTVGQPFQIWTKAQVRYEQDEFLVINQGAVVSQAVQAQSVAGQPWYLWKTAPRLDEPEDYRVSSSNLHLYRTGYQTVGQPWFLHKAPQRVHEEEPDATRVDHTRLLFGKTAAASPGAPWFLWKPQVRHTAPDDVIVISQGAAASPAAIAQQASPGQPWYLWKTKQVEQDEPDATRVNHALRFQYGRQAAASQQWFMYAPAVAPQFVEPEPDRQDHAKRLLFGRTAVAATPGAPWYLWKPQVRHTAAEEVLVINQGAAASPAAITPQAIPGAPWYLWKAQVRHTDPEDYTVPKPSTFALTRVTFGQQWYINKPATSPQDVEDDPPRTDHAKRILFGRVTPPTAPGQPWFMWPSATADQTTEPNPVVTDHAEALYPFRPHDAITPVAPLADVIPGAPHWPLWVAIINGRRVVGSYWDIRRAVEDFALEQAERSVSVEKPKRVRIVVQPGKPTGRQTPIPQAKAKEIQADVRSFYKEAFKRYKEQIELDDDDEAILLLL